MIAGAADLLRRDRPILFVEIFGGDHSNPDPEATVEEIRAYGYEPFTYASVSSLLNLNAPHDAGLLPYEKHRDNRYNYLFIPRPRV